MKKIVNFESPSVANMQRIGAANFQVFCDAGYRIATALAPIMKGVPSATSGSQLKVLDFGCGCGRVLLQLAGNLQDVQFAGTDVDSSAVDFLTRQLPNCQISKNSFLPPLPYSDGEFDIAYSISIWTHLAPRHQIPWLMELRRVVRAGGLLLISTSSETALIARKKRKDPGWEHISNDDLLEKGIIFIPYPDVVMERGCPGVTEEYGLTLHHPNWIRTEFSPYFAGHEVRKDLIDGVQDLVIFTR